MPFSDADKSNLRRHLGYPAQGLYRTSVNGMTTADGAAGFRYFTAYGALEWRMNNLMPDEESRILGRAYAAVGILGAPVEGQSISIQITGGGLGSPQTITVTAGPTSGFPNKDALTLTQALVVACVNNGLIIPAGFEPVAPYGAGPFSERFFPNPTFALNNPTAFTIAILSQGISIGGVIQANGQLLTPLYVANQGTPQQTNIYGYLPILDVLEGAQATTTENLDTSKADVWTARSTEIKERARLYELWRGKLAGFLNVPLGDDVYSVQAKNLRRGGFTRLVV